MKPYEEIKHRIRHGDTYATASPAFISRVIRFFSRAKVSHVGVFVKVGRRRWAVESLEGYGVRAMYASKRFKTEPLTLYRGGKINVRQIADSMGDEYDTKGALSALWFDTKSTPSFCSEAVAKWLRLDFSELNRGVLPSDICSKLKRIV